MKVKSFLIKRENSHAREVLQEAYFKKNLGLLGDVKSKGGDKQVSILSYNDRKLIDEKDLKGLCTNRFHENITIEDLNVEGLEIGDVLKIGESIQEITKIGKGCFDECNLFKSGNKCPLSIGVVFTRVIESGKAKVGDNIEKLKN